MRSFILQIIVFTLFVSAADLCWIIFMPLNKHIPHAWIMVGFFAAMTALFHFLAIRASKGRPQAFIRFYMGSTAIRFFLYIMIIIAYRFHDKITLIPFAIGFMAHYFLFTFFEVPVLLKKLQEQ